MTNDSFIMLAYTTAKDCRSALDFVEKFSVEAHSLSDRRLGQCLGEVIRSRDNVKSVEEMTQALHQRRALDRAISDTLIKHRIRYDDEHSAALSFHTFFTQYLGE